MHQPLLGLREVERRLGLTRWTLYEMIRKGSLPAVKLKSGHYRVSEQAVEEIAQGLRKYEAQSP